LDIEARPIIDGIIRRRLYVSLSSADGTHRNQDALEISSDVTASLIEELRKLKRDPQSKSIQDFRGYVAVVTYHSCYALLRRKYPERHRLKNRLRYLLTHHENFALWESQEKELLCGLAAWRGRESAMNNDCIQQLQDEPHAFAGAAIAHIDIPHLALADLLTAIFKRIGGAFELDDLVDSVAALQGIKDQAMCPEDDEKNKSASDQFPDPHVDVATELDQRAYLAKLWMEICQLPLRQRMALLLNMRGAQGEDCIFLFPAIGIAGIRQIAEILEIPAEEFAALWNDLPLEDATIAQRFGVTRQQVINLRKSARARLARRMKDF
jgi:hypothetical protein